MVKVEDPIKALEVNPPVEEIILLAGAPEDKEDLKKAEDPEGVRVQKVPAVWDLQEIEGVKKVSQEMDPVVEEAHGKSFGGNYKNVSLEVMFYIFV